PGRAGERRDRRAGSAVGRGGPRLRRAPARRAARRGRGDRPLPRAPCPLQGAQGRELPAGPPAHGERQDRQGAAPDRGNRMSRAIRGRVPWTALLLAAALLASCSPTARSPRPAPADTAPSPAAPAAAAPSAEDPAAADERAVAAFYRGKTIRLLVGTAAGGSYDVVARTVARHLGKHVPGNPGVIVENMPGANNLVAANYMYRVGPKDGTLIQSFVGSLIVRQLFGAPGVEFDATRLHYLGAPATDAYVLIVTRKSGVTRIEETFGPSGKSLVLGTLGPGSPLEVGPTLLRDFFGANLRLVSGYDGAAKIRLAIDSNELDGTFTSWQEIRSTSRDKFEGGEWLVLRQAAAEPQPEIASVPSLLDLARDDQQRQLLRLA